MRTALTVSTLGLVAAVALAGCSGDQKTEASKSADAVKSAAAAQTTQPDGSFGARKELSKASCTADPAGAWTFKGTLTNAQKTTQEYVVTASVVDGKTYTVLGSKELKQKLEAGKTADLTADKFFTRKADGAQCVLRVTRKPA